MIDADSIRRIALRHGLPDDVRAMPRLGMENELWALGDGHVLRIPLRGNPAGMVVEALTVPVAVEAGVRTPALVVFDQTREVIDNVYTIYERAPGETLGILSCDVPATQLIRGLAEDIVKLHRLPNPGLQPNHPEATGHDFAALPLPAADARAIERWMAALRPAVDAQPAPVFTHSDLHPWNLMVADGRLTGILDWSDCVWGDPAFDLIGLPLPLMIELLDAYREAGGATDDSIEARMLWYWLDLAMWEIGDLDSENFKRCWWRWPEGGLLEVLDRLSDAGLKWRRLIPETNKSN